MRILILDIETKPGLAAVFGLWNQNIGLPALFDSGEMMSFAAKWYGDKSIVFSSTFHQDKETMLLTIYTLLEEADAVVTFNGERFDLKILNQEFLKIGLAPVKPYLSIDLYRTVKNRFRGISNKLNWWLNYLDIPTKEETGGMQLWVDCMNNDPDAWEKMMTYNIADVDRTEQLYTRLLPWIPNHPVGDVSVDSAGNVVVACACGSTHLQRRGYKRTASGLYYKQYQCQKCGKWHRQRTSERDIPKSSVVHAGQI